MKLDLLNATIKMLIQPIRMQELERINFTTTLQSLTQQELDYAVGVPYSATGTYVSISQICMYQSIHISMLLSIFLLPLCRLCDTS